MDEFDDDALRRSIEAADKAGEWRDPNSKFEDPKLTALAKQLAEPPRANYTERRLLELERRAAEKEKPAAPRPKPEFRVPEEAAPVAPLPSNWREAIVRQPAAPSLADPAPAAPAAGTPETPPAPLAAVPVVGAVAGMRSVAAAAVVFACGLAAQIAIAGWQPNLGVRAACAALVTGSVWHLWGPGRFRCAAVGTAAHLIAFVSTGNATTSTELFAMFVGTLIVMLASGAVGLMREESSENHPAA